MTKTQCAQCGKMFSKRSHMKHGIRKYCSKQCRNEAPPVPAQYPWDKWFSKNSFVVRAQDYKCQTHGMMSQIRNRARLLNKKVSVRANKNGTISVVVSAQ